MGTDANILLTEDRGAVRLLTLNRPEKLNALNATLINALSKAIADAAEDEGVRALVMAGAGRAFSAGADLKETAALTTEPEIARHADRLLGLFKATIAFPKPVIAAVDGFALGGGCGLAMCSDIIFTSKNSTFGFPEIKRGVMPALVTPILIRRVGSAMALKLIWSGESFSADKFAVIDQTVTVTMADEALPTAVEHVGELTKMNMRVVREIKSLVRASEITMNDAFKEARKVNISERIAKQKRS